MAPHVQTLDPPAVADCRPYYSPLATVQGPVKLIYTAGQVGRRKTGEAAKSYEEQVCLAFQNLHECLAAAGATPADIVKLTYFIVDYKPQNRYHAQVLLEFLKGHRPPATLVPIMQLARPEYKFEIEAVAAIRDLRAVQPIERPALGGALTADVVVIGAGLSGLQAAHDIQRQGFSCVVLEARDRVGGKTWSQPTKNGSVVDVGAAWINDSNQSRMFALARRFGLELIEQLSEGNCAAQIEGEDTSIIFPYGEIPGFSEEEKLDIVRIRTMWEELCHTIDIKQPKNPEYDSLTVEELVRKQGGGAKALATVSIWTRAFLGCEPSEISSLYFLDYCKSGGGLLQMRSDRKDGGQYLRVRKGTQSFSVKIAESMVCGSVILDAPVHQISQNKSGATVTTVDGTRYHCKKVIVSVPTPVYKDLIFSPPLPLDKAKYSSSTTLGYYAKVILLWTKPWWREQGFCGMTQSFVGPSAVTRDSSDEQLGQFSLTCFVTGKPGRVWSKLSASKRREAIFAQLIKLFGAANEGKIRAPVEVFEQEWAKDPWSRGCPCPYPPPGVMTDVGAALRATFGALHFVGTETAFEWKGYMEGAVRSGERGATEVCDALSDREIHVSAKL